MVLVRLKALILVVICISLATCCETLENVRFSLFKKVMYTDFTTYLSTSPGVMQDSSGQCQLTCAETCLESQECSMFIMRNSECFMIGPTAQTQVDVNLTTDDVFYVKEEGKL